MQFMIINVPAGEQVASLSHSLNADELLIGQSESCQIRLPDRQNQVAEQHARLTREGPLWYVENLSDRPLHLNQVEVPTQASQRLLLSDADILSCGGYQLVASDFTPWLNATDRTGKPELTATEDQDPVPEQYALAPTIDGEEDEEALDDPFAREPASAGNQSDSGDVDVAVSADDKPLVELALTTNLRRTVEGSFTSPENHTPLIDVLSEPNDLDDDWSIHRGLWYGKITQPQESFYSPLTASTPGTPAKQQRSICKAMLTALDQAIKDFCPDHLSEQFMQSITSTSLAGDIRRTRRIRQYFRRQTDTPPPDVASGLDFLPRYQRYYQQLMDSKRYRLLFLQRFRQALKEQEQLLGSNDD
ncbi:FHA domain-containing protein [Endozoicomonas euniceicola]|uniref:FHA domain-containing protein n=1 Tax=Endozoicomonas euniceicola TaxID=1234143 RepID=A0ABY6GQ39_9GAMM|nr:FHA domain-containing protein [Endozoicomonas euniceicola]UYM14864.1 FHA domain-containing protein [Endozoicomonas euniceicola]